MQLDSFLGQQFQVVFWCARNVYKMGKNILCAKLNNFSGHEKSLSRKNKLFGHEKNVCEKGMTVFLNMLYKKRKTPKMYRTAAQIIKNLILGQVKTVSRNLKQKNLSRKLVHFFCSFCTHALDKKRKTTFWHTYSGQKKGNKAFVHMLWTRKVEHRFWTDVEHRKNCTTFLNTRCRQKKFHTVGLCKLF